MVKTGLAHLKCVVLLVGIATINGINAICCYGFYVSYKCRDIIHPNPIKCYDRICYDGTVTGKMISMYCGYTTCNPFGCFCDSCRTNSKGYDRPEAVKLFRKMYNIEGEVNWDKEFYY